MAVVQRARQQLSTVKGHLVGRVYVVYPTNITRLPCFTVRTSLCQKNNNNMRDLAAIGEPSWHRSRRANHVDPLCTVKLIPAASMSRMQSTS